MGIDFSHGDAHWSYSGFHQFRLRVAESIGINLDEMVGFGSFLDPDPPKVPKKSWDTVNDDIKYLLDHSDCDGGMTPEVCLKVAKRLREIITSWNTESTSDFRRDYNIEHGLALASGMEEAANKNDNFEFC